MSALSGVSRTAILTLRARADEHRRSNHLFADPIAAQWSARLGWPRELDAWYSDFTQIKTAVRAHQLDEIVRVLAADGEPAVAIELGGGFSTRAARVALPHLTWIVLDLPPVIAARAELGEHTRAIAGSALDPRWLDELRGQRAIIVAEGLLYYLPRADVDRLFAVLRAERPGTPMAFDVIGEQDLARSVRDSTRAGAPIAWAVTPPFEAAQAAMGLEVIAGLEPARIVAGTVAGFETRYGPMFAWTMRAAGRLRHLADRRSGIMVGRLRAP